jgi:hypothetical protein
MFLRLVLLGSCALPLAWSATQPLVPPPAPLIPPTATAGLALASPWFATGWDDGLAEVATYDLAQSRYGQQHPGEAVLVAVRETMDPQRRVKSVDGTGIPVLKLHFIRSFQTGVYRYDQSSFQLVRRSDGVPMRWFITSHEWCGAASKSWINGGPLTVSSYFDGHGDVAQDLDLGPEGVLADSLGWWARAWSRSPTAPATVQVVPSQIEARCVTTTLQPAIISQERTTLPQVIADRPAGTPAWLVTVRRGEVSDRLLLTDDDARTLLRWDQGDGSRLTLRSLRRFAYWQHHEPQDRP